MNKQEKNKIRQLTFVVEYKEMDSNFDQPLQIIRQISNSLLSYNKNVNRAYNSKVAITGVWLEPEEVSVEKQNELFNELKQE